MAAGPNIGKLHLSEHLPNRHVTVCRPNFHTTLEQLRQDLSLVRAQLDKQQRQLSATEQHLTDNSAFARQLTVPAPAERKERESIRVGGEELISTLVRRRYVDRSGEELKKIEEKYAKRMADVVARENKYREEMLADMRARLTSSASPRQEVKPLFESSFYIRHYC